MYNHSYAYLQLQVESIWLQALPPLVGVSCEPKPLRHDSHRETWICVVTLAVLFLLWYPLLCKLCLPYSGISCKSLAHFTVTPYCPLLGLQSLIVLMSCLTKTLSWFSHIVFLLLNLLHKQRTHRPYLKHAHSRALK